jgi:hypothetical protein
MIYHNKAVSEAERQRGREAERLTHEQQPSGTVLQRHQRGRLRCLGGGSVGLGVQRLSGLQAHAVAQQSSTA